MPEVEFQANGRTAPGYLAVPEPGSGPGVVVLQEWWGVDDSVKRMVDAFAEEGFVALAPDLYHGETTEQPDEAQQKMMAMNMEETEKELRGAVDYVSEHEAYDGSGIGAVGFCLGGGLAVWAGTANPKVDAVVTYYYVMPHGKPDFSKLDAPVLGHFGNSDDFVPVDDAKALEKEIDEATDHQVEFVFYEGAGHAFSNDHNRMGTYHEGHAQKAWRGTVDFLKKTFKRSD
ncbi:MAG TPA: dienelactone hydrolase family protein [Thermoleophilaceae bacterium]|nr:dienelactone hydrolase family protein [Thermoleophilaceae bacterium]